MLIWLEADVLFGQSSAAQQSATESIALVQQLKADVERLRQEKQKFEEDILQLQAAHVEEIKDVQQESAVSLAGLQNELRGVTSNLDIASSCVTGWKERCQGLEHKWEKAVQEEAARTDSLEKKIVKMKKQADHDAHISSIYEVKSQQAAAELDKAKVAHAEALEAAQGESAASIKALKCELSEVTQELMAMKERANDTVLEWKGRSEKAIEELDKAKGAHEEALGGVKADAAIRIQALEHQLVEASNEMRDAKKRVDEAAGELAGWKEKCKADFIQLREAQVAQGEAAACIHAMEQQLAEMARATGMVETQRDEAVATADKWMKQVTSIQEANEKQDTAVKKAAQAREEALKQESSDRVSQAVEKLSAEHQQAMQAFREECEASIQERLSKQNDKEQVMHFLTCI